MLVRSCNLNKKLLTARENHRLLQFFMKLNDEHYAMVRANILMMQPLLVVNHAYRLLV